MLAHKLRVCARGRYPLQDWLLPVLYQQDPFDFGFAKKAKLAARESHLPKELREQRDAYGFIGRDGPILEMERALHRKSPAILVQGLGGVGKTTLARGFLRWLDDTGGLDGALWFDFRDIRTAEYVINRTGEAFYGDNFRLAPNKLDLLARALGERRVLIVWDNFESATANVTTEDRTELGRFLDAIRGGRGKVIVTSRSREEWLKPEWRFELSLRGLVRWRGALGVLRDDPAGSRNKGQSERPGADRANGPARGAPGGHARRAAEAGRDAGGQDRGGIADQHRGTWAERAGGAGAAVRYVAIC